MIARIKEKISELANILYNMARFRTRSRVRTLGPVFIWGKNIKFGNNVILFPGVNIFGHGLVEIGDNVAIGKDTIICSGERISIGSDTLISGQCYVVDMDHGVAKDELIRKQPMECLPIEIGSDVWLGAGCKVLKGSKVSRGVVAGANTVINGEIDEYNIVVGAPFRILKNRT